MIALSPLLREAMCWFAIGSALAAFVCAAVIILAASAPGLGGSAAVVRAVGKTVDGVICPERNVGVDRNRLRPARRSYDSFDRSTLI